MNKYCCCCSTRQNFRQTAELQRRNNWTAAGSCFFAACCPRRCVSVLFLFFFSFVVPFPQSCFGQHRHGGCSLLFTLVAGKDLASAGFSFCTVVERGEEYSPTQVTCYSPTNPNVIASCSPLQIYLL